MRTKWVIACGMRRSGSTVQYHLAREIIKLNGGLDLGFVIWQDFEEKFAENNGQYPYVIAKSHVFLPSYCPSISIQNWKNGQWAYGVSTYRPTRDIYASLKRMYPNLGNAELEKDMYAIYFEEALKWFSLPRILWTKYSSLLSVEGMTNECSRIASLIKAKLSAEEAEAIAQDHIIERQLERLSDEFMTPRKKLGQNDQYNYDYYMWKNHIGGVENGRWVVELCKSEIEFCKRIESMIPQGFLND